MAGKRYSREFRERAVALVFEQVAHCSSQWEAICSVAATVGVSGESLRKWVLPLRRSSRGSSTLDPHARNGLSGPVRSRADL
ncbi:transposase [Amycolatopsis pigmentata]|uniref:Transposase n=1 Tax=Amycolatopsis pigmentata TaxID=450801 RepID=A0ABW5G725_9PSEU